MQREQQQVELRQREQQQVELRQIQQRQEELARLQEQQAQLQQQLEAATSSLNAQEISTQVQRDLGTERLRYRETQVQRDSFIYVSVYFV